MARLTANQQIEVSEEYGSLINSLRASASTRNILYDLRKGYYDGTIVPTVEKNCDIIYTQYAATIVDKFAAYAVSNGFSIKIKPEDVSDPIQVVGAEMVNRIIDKLYNENDEFMVHCHNVFHSSGLYGDGYLGTNVKDGVPEHYAVQQPQNIFLLFDDDNYNTFYLYMYERGVDIDLIAKTYGVDVVPTEMQKPGYVYGSQNTQNNPYGINQMGNGIKNFKQNFTNSRMGTVTVIHDFENNKRVQMVNNKAVMADEGLENIYHLIGNYDPGNPYGVSDFETVAQIITKLEEKLSEQSDAATSAVHHKIITDQNAADIKAKWNSRKTQAFKVSSTPQPGRLEILNTSINSYPMEQYMGTLMNILRTGSGLQELGQDTVSANVSGRAIAYMFQGVTQKIKTKRLRFNSLINQMVIDDLEILAESDKELKKAAFENGVFKLKIDVKYPPVMEQDEQIRISNLQTMTAAGLISKYSARLQLSDYIDDPTEESKKIKEEQEEELQQQLKLKQAEAQMSQPQASAASVKPEEMDTAASTEGMGQVSTKGNAGTALNEASAAGMQNQMAQNQTGQQF